MVTLFVLLIIGGILLTILSGMCAILLDPIIAILMIYGLYKLVKKITKKKK